MKLKPLAASADSKTLLSSLKNDATPYDFRPRGQIEGGLPDQHSCS